MKEGWDREDRNRGAGIQPGVRLGHWELSFWQQQGKRLSQLATGQQSQSAFIEYGDCISSKKLRYKAGLFKILHLYLCTQ